MATAAPTLDTWLSLRHGICLSWSKE
jgi:hypothetical protein